MKKIGYKKSLRVIDNNIKFQDINKKKIFKIIKWKAWIV